MALLLIFASYSMAAAVSIIAKRRGIIEFVTIVAAVIALALALFIAMTSADIGTYTAIALFSADAMSMIMMLIIAVVGFGATVYSVKYLQQEIAKQIIGFTRVKQYFVLLNLFILAMFLAVTANSPILAWIAVEVTTLSTAFLISFYNKPSSMEAAWKYLIINSVGLLLGFFGTLLYFTSIGDSNSYGFVSWQTLAATATQLDPVIVKIAFMFVLIGYGTKVGLAPMHTWLPDAHSKAPAPVSALLSGVLLNVAFLIILRFKTITDVVVGASFSQNLLILFGTLSIVIAGLIIITQTSYKRLLAYSSIENMGLIALGFGFGGLGVFASTVHMIYHALVKSAIFFLSGNFLLKFHSAKINNVRGALQALPVTSTLFFIGFFVITGAPPFGIFFTKISILAAGMSTYPSAVVFILLVMALLFIGFLKHITAMIFGEKPTEIVAGEGSIWLIIPALVFLAIVFYLSFHLPSFLSTLINQAVAQY